jgi:hypothetical protein
MAGRIDGRNDFIDCGKTATDTVVVDQDVAGTG